MQTGKTATRKSLNDNAIIRTTLICVMLVSVANACGGLLGLDGAGVVATGTGGYDAGAGVGGTGPGGAGIGSGGTVLHTTDTSVGDCSGIATDFLLDAGLNPACNWVAWNTGGTTSSSSCEFTLPSPANGPYDPSFMALYLFPTIGTTEQIPQTTSQGACTKSSGGFGFDNLSNPTRVFLCPCTCAHAQSVGGQVEIMLSCGVSGRP
jgi:hypothetical protein